MNRISRLAHGHRGSRLRARSEQGQTGGQSASASTTLAPLAARRVAEMVGLGEGIAAIELVVAAQAVDLRQPSALGAGTRRAHEAVRAVVPFTGAGEAVPSDLEPVRELVRSGELA